MASEGFRYAAAETQKLSDDLRNYNAAIAAIVDRYGAGATAVLDFGAGVGTLSLLVRERGFNPVCLEPDPEQRAELQRRGLTVVAGLSEVASGSLDYIYSSNVLEHVEDDVATLRELRGKLRDGGLLLLYLPAFQSLFSSMDELVGHHRRYDKRMLADKLRAAGFSVEDTFYADVLGYFATLAYRMLGNRTANINSTSMRTYDRFIFPMGRAIESVVRVPVGKNVVGVARKT